MSRSAEIRTLTSLAASATNGKTVIATISGMAGTGKTALAVHWAHQIPERFPDGQLWVNLRGFDPSGTPVTPAEAIRTCLDALGVTGAQLPVGLEEQVALSRSLMAGKRLLVLLDNARTRTRCACCCQAARPAWSWSPAGPSSPGSPQPAALTC